MYEKSPKQSILIAISEKSPGYGSRQHSESEHILEKDLMKDLFKDFQQRKTYYGL